MDDLPEKPEAARPCPICGKPTQPKRRPFCSARCATIDLGRWLGGNYRVPVSETDEAEQAAEDED